MDALDAALSFQLWPESCHFLSLCNVVVVAGIDREGNCDCISPEDFPSLYNFYSRSFSSTDHQLTEATLDEASSPEGLHK